VEGKSLYSRDECLKQDKQERRKKLCTGKISFTLSIFSLIANKDKFTGWQTSHPPLYFLLEIENWKMCKTPPSPLFPHQENCIESVL